jgi:hypothetical protein
MKTQTQFKNASLVSVVNGSIVVKDSTGREHTFLKASVVSVNDGTIIIESEWKPKKGELVKITGCNCDSYSLFDEVIDGNIFTFGFISLLNKAAYRFSSGVWSKAGTAAISPVTPEEQKKFDDFCKSQGKIWNRETLQWEKYKWEPKMGETYYFIDTLGEVSYTRNNTLNLDPTRIKYGNCFPTKERAKEAAEKLKEFFKSL